MVQQPNSFSAWFQVQYMKILQLVWNHHVGFEAFNANVGQLVSC